MGTEMQAIRTHMNANPRRRALLLAVLEFIVGGIVLLGGAALVYFSIDATGKTLGIVHAFLGLMAFPAGYLLLMGKARAQVLTLGIDVAIIAFSTGSEVILSTTGSLASGPFTDSIIGTTMGGSHCGCNRVFIDAYQVSNPCGEAEFSSLKETEFD